MLDKKFISILKKDYSEKNSQRRQIISTSNIILNNSSLIYEYFKDLFINEEQETFYAIYLDAKSKLSMIIPLSCSNSICSEIVLADFNSINLPYKK